ncbi:ABC transporter ATP-binding protein [Actinotalea sp. Marseille-Q4924]|uniref:ABC transporter ATP-binding protein n=1 Tax=Actinotalea sp. Marseille-Q4924 TaxID=2866571 RepID=UPI001CE43553|nr:ABC transporter ATP-binding protein [Actinotalea sp. Marseille-Q4924]
MSDVELRAVEKSFTDAKGHSTAVLHGVNIMAPSGKFVVLLGPSGCGKSTSLRIIAGLEQATAGEVLIDGQRVNDIPAAKRDVAMVFQNYALYPHLSVMENIVFGLRVRKVDKKTRERQGREAAEKVGLTPFLDRRPSQLSGGQRQRAALARALVSDAKVVLMDEPLSNLDAKLRHQMRIELRALQRDLALTVIYVTHDQVEAMTMADHVVVMRDGDVAQAASPVDLYVDPADAGVAAFIGSPPMNLLPVEARDGELVVPGSEARWPVSVGGSSKELLLGVRPETLSLTERTGAATFAGRVRTTEILGAETLLTVEVTPEHSVVARMPGIVRVDEGARVVLQADPDQLRFFDRDTRLRIPMAELVEPGGGR